MERLKTSTWWIFVITAIALLPALFLRDFTPPNELRYLSIIDEALENGSIWCFTNHGSIYADKPPLYFWLLMAAHKLTGGHYMWVYALFSVIPMLLIGRILDGMVKPIFTIRQRQLALLTLFTCAFFPVMGVTLRMDMLMTLWIVLSMREVYRMALGKPTVRHGALLGLYAFLALFTKGPFGLLFPLIASIVWLISIKKGKMFFQIWNWATWLVIICGAFIWFYNVYCEGSTEYLNNLLFHQTIDRAHNAFHHKKPFYFYAIAIWYVMAPWSLLMLYNAIKNRKTAFSSTFKKLTGVTALVIFFVLSCVSSKLPIYLLPAVPFAIYWCASFNLEKGLYKTVRVTSFVLLGIIFFGCMLFPWINPYFGYGDVAKEVETHSPTIVLVDKSVRRGENIDAYFENLEVKMVNTQDSVVTLPKGAALITKDKKLKKIVAIYESDSQL